MSHLLSTVNPQAAGAEPYDVPPVGMRVLYYARPGENGSAGRKSFAADVMASDPTKGTCTLWVLRGPEDYREYVHVYQRSDQNPYGCWDYIDDGIDGILADLDETKSQLASLQKAVFGEFNPIMKGDGTPKSVYELLQEFETRVFAAERAKK